MGNPNSNLVDIEAVAEIAHRHHIPVIVDNTFATPYLLRPIERGADIVVHSATKFIGGHGTTIAGVIIDGGKFDRKAAGEKISCLTKPNSSCHGAVFTKVAGNLAYIAKARTLLRDTGAALSPFNAFLQLQGPETLSLRVERHVENALKAIDFLKKHPMVAKVNHPSLEEHRDHGLYKRYFPKGGGSIFTDDIIGDLKQAPETLKQEIPKKEKQGGGKKNTGIK